MAFVDWATLRQQVLDAISNAVANGGMLHESYNMPVGGGKFRSLKDLRDWLDYIDKQIAIEDRGGRVTTAGRYFP